jgi:GTP pyrophosphokinase
VRVFDGWPDFAAARAELANRLPVINLDWLAQVYEFAGERHAGQTRPAGEPYARHLLEVVDVLVNGVGVTDRVLLAAGMLHDTVEDTDTALDEVAERFGADVADLVDWVTQPAEAGSRAGYLTHLRDAPPEVVTLKLSDRASNVQRLDTHPRPAKQRSYYRETVAHMVPLSAGHPFFEPWFEKWQATFAHLAAPAEG